MSNPNPNTEPIKKYQFKRTSTEPLGKQIGVCFPVSVKEKLDAMGKDRIDFIRNAVAIALEGAKKT